MEKLTWAEFFAAYMYVQVVLRGRKYEGSLNEASCLEAYQRYLVRGYFSADVFDGNLYATALSRLNIGA